jgi:hypothetical protein
MTEADAGPVKICPLWNSPLFERRCARNMDPALPTTPYPANITIGDVTSKWIASSAVRAVSQLLCKHRSPTFLLLAGDVDGVSPNGNSRQLASGSRLQGSDRAWHCRTAGCASFRYAFLLHSLSLRSKDFFDKARARVVPKTARKGYSEATGDDCRRRGICQPSVRQRAVRVAGGRLGTRSH